MSITSRLGRSVAVVVGVCASAAVAGAAIVAPGFQETVVFSGLTQPTVVRFASDGVERRLPIHAHGIEVLEARSGKFDGQELAFSIELPAQRDPGTTRLAVQVTPSMAVTMLDALPYLVDYPYGCTEQTLSRFLPCAVVAKTLRDRGLSVEDAMTRVFGGIEGESAGRTHPDGKKASTSSTR